MKHPLRFYAQTVVLGAACVLGIAMAGTAASASPGGNAAASSPPAAAASEDTLAPQINALLADSNAYWSRFFTALGGHYPPPTLMLFDHDLSGVCSWQQAVIGPFYCPPPQVIYLDRGFLQAALKRTSGNGTAALAYVLAHEVAHHVQDLVGTTAAVDTARTRSTPALSARTWMVYELQADCYAGLWLQSAAHDGRVQLGDPAALLEGIAAVSHEWQGHVRPNEMVPDPVLSYGTAAQRLAWFQHGLNGKGFADCDTFSAEAAGKL
jgi:predicted metalloprotease